MALRLFQKGWPVMGYMESLKELYSDYARDVEAQEKTRRPTEGMLGIGRKPGEDPCHERFFNRLGALTEEMARDGVSGDELAETAKMILTEEKRTALPSYAHWMLLAAHRHVLPLIPHLTPDAAGRLLSEYESAYPRFRRLPMQKEIIKALRQAAGK